MMKAGRAQPLGVFSTRSPNRPNPIGVHRVQILAVEGLRIEVSELEVHLTGGRLGPGRAWVVRPTPEPGTSAAA
jgi:tRNA-methyltransferase O